MFYELEKTAAQAAGILLKIGVRWKKTTVRQLLEILGINIQIIGQAVA